jgi:hypothetical protein
MSSYSERSGSGIGCLGVVQIVFIILKLTDLIDWSWWWVFSPALAMVGIFILALLFVVAFKAFD